jgi:hypothetical protein
MVTFSRRISPFFPEFRHFLVSARGKLGLTGTGEGNIITIDLPQPIDDQLRSAATVEVHLANVQVDQVFQFTLAKQKMPALLTAVSKCRATIR